MMVVWIRVLQQEMMERDVSEEVRATREVVNRVIWVGG